ncbi:MAG: DegV family protein [Oscillospiraceae bacterium]
MSEYILFTDSSCDLPASLAEELELKILPLVVNVNGTEFHNYLDERELKFSDFYSTLRGGAMATTSAPSVGAFQNEMRDTLKAGKDILCISFSSALSSTCQNASIAAQQLMEEFPERKVFVIDSKCASLGQGLLVYLAARKKKEGLSIDELRDYVERTAPAICHWFTVDDLFFLKRGGRISATTAAVGAVLHIKPVLHVDDEGRLINMSKTRGRKASIKAMYDKVAGTSEDISKQTVFISHGDCLEDAEYLASMIRDNLNPVDIIINHVGPVIGAHSGPGTLAVFFTGPVR